MAGRKRIRARTSSGLRREARLAGTATDCSQPGRRGPPIHGDYSAGAATGFWPRVAGWRRVPSGVAPNCRRRRPHPWRQCLSGTHDIPTTEQAWRHRDPIIVPAHRHPHRRRRHLRSLHPAAPRDRRSTVAGLRLLAAGGGQLTSSGERLASGGKELSARGKELAARGHELAAVRVVHHHRQRNH